MDIPNNSFYLVNNKNLVDMSNQVDNDWDRDTILAFANKSKNQEYAIRLKNRDKSKIKKKFIYLKETESARKHNKKVINLIFAYLIFKILSESKGEKEKVYICPDHRPTREVHHYIQKLSKFNGYPNLTEEKDIDFINRNKFNVPKSNPAHKFAKKVYQGKKNAKIAADFEELESLISKLL